MTPRKTSFVPGKARTMSRKFVTIVANMATSHMIVRSLQNLTRNKKIMTINTRHQRKVMRRRTTRRKGLSQEKRRSRLFVENGSRMVNPQVMTQVMKNPRKRLGIAIHDDDDDDGDEAPLPPPPMCFMARGNSKVSDDDDSSSDESEHWLSPNELQNILDEYQQVIKKYKSKCKVFEIEYAKLKTSNNELIVRHNEVVETHDSSIVPSNQLKEEHDKLLIK